MGKPAARVGDNTAHGSPLAPGIGSVNVMIGKMPAWRALSDQHLCPIVKGVVPDVGGVVMLGSLTVMTNCMMQARMGDQVVEIPGGPNPILKGEMTVMVGDVAVVPPAMVPPIILIPAPPIPAAGGSGAAGGLGGAGGGKPGAKNTSQGKTMSAAKKAGAPFTKLNCNLQKGKPGKPAPKKAAPRKRR